MKPTVAFQESLYGEMLARIKEDDQSVPCTYGGWLYYSRTETGKQYSIHCRKRRRQGGGGGHARPECAGRGARVLWRLEVMAVSDDGRVAGLQRRLHGLSRIHAVREGSRLGRAAGGADREGVVGGVGGRLGHDSSTCSRTRPSGPIVCCATGWARRSPRTRCSTRRRTSCSASACGARAAGASCSPAQRQLHRDRNTRYLPASEPAGAVAPAADARRRTTSTRWTTAPARAAASSTSGPTAAAGGTSASVTAPVDDPRPGALAGADRPSRRRDARGRGRLRRPLRRPRAGRGPDPAARITELTDRRVHHVEFPRAHLRAVSRRATPSSRRRAYPACATSRSSRRRRCTTTTSR